MSLEEELITAHVILADDRPVLLKLHLVYEQHWLAVTQKLFNLFSIHLEFGFS